MIIHCFNIVNICRAICQDEHLSERNIWYFLAGVVEMMLFDAILLTVLR